MDLDEWILRKKRVDKTFTDQTFAKALGISRRVLGEIKRGESVPKGRVARNIEKLTKGQVSGWLLICRNLDLEDERNQKL